mmetsp:Transcript_20262/g.36401  ORF Transcript_20262/g.36401 Transcript_20262/m.36401 type:complete len:220 (-) Transcript_20262:91-750(-)
MLHEESDLVFLSKSDILGVSLSLFVVFGCWSMSAAAANVRRFVVPFGGKLRLSARLTRLVGEEASSAAAAPSDKISTSSSSDGCVSCDSAASLDFCCSSRYKTCLPTVDPPPITRKTSPLGPSTTLSYSSSKSLSNLAGDNFTLNLGEDKSSSRSTSSLLSNSVINRFCSSFGRTFDLVISCESFERKWRYLFLVLRNGTEIFLRCSSLAVRGGRSICA